MWSLSNGFTSAFKKLDPFRNSRRRQAGPHQFVLHRKVDRAKELLRAADMRVLDVAVACGFKSQHFARVFRKVCGANPTEYRQEFAPTGLGNR
jgi:transcriptional regulator GlxA family with amidase domain